MSIMDMDLRSEIVMVAHMRQKRMNINPCFIGSLPVCIRVRERAVARSHTHNGVCSSLYIYSRRGMINEHKP